MEPSPTVEIIIPHYRRRDMLERCLASLSRCPFYASPSLSILVICNGTADAALQKLIANYPTVKLLALAENRGYAGGCNAGLQQSNAEYLIFLNDDTEHEADWLEALLAIAQSNQNIAALQPKILSLEHAKQGKRRFEYAGAAGGMIDKLGYPWCWGRTFFRVETDGGQYDKARNIFWASGVALCVRRSVALEVGGFDEDFFMQMEEIDLCWRIQLAGYPIYSAPSSVVYHAGGASLAEGSAEKIYYNHRNNITMLLKNRSLVALLWIMPIRMVMELGAALFYLTKADGLKKSGMVFRALRDQLRAMPTTLRKRRTIQTNRTVSDRQLFHHQPFFHLLNHLIPQLYTFAQPLKNQQHHQ
uniref:Glycosyl transferase n=1 Tax=Chlorobium chlorochromatii (strain CaD3) TaxID=340177 RepID=Q3AQZ9_CHLCH